MNALIDLFLLGSLTLYAVFGGADYGAGIWEAVGRNDKKGHRDLVTHAIGPVWEANHVWLIIAVVILFTAFPSVFSQVSTSFHLPLTALLFGITLRGCAFTFRHYDAIQDERSQGLYTAIFKVASLVTPVLLGTIAGGILLGRTPPPLPHPPSFYDAFMAPWCNPFSFSIGLFFAALCAFTAAVFLCGETAVPEQRQVFVARALKANAAAVFAGALSILAARLSGLDLYELFINHPLSLACVGLATIAAPVLHLSLRQNWTHLPRLIVAGQFACVLAGCFLMRRVLPAQPEASLATQRQLLLALGVGSCLLFPALGYLFYVFKFKRAAI